MAVFAAARSPRRAPVAFHYAAQFGKLERDWYSRFELLVTGGILAANETQALLDSGCRLIAYEWSSAFYPGDAVSARASWQAAVMARGSSWILNPSPVGGGAAELGRAAIWYDFADPEFRSQRAAHVAEQVREAGYAGVFLDTLGFEQLPAALQKVFATRHPDLDYEVCQAEFLKQLRVELGSSGILFLNQGYRKADLFLPYADYDLSESYFTSTTGVGTRFHPWHDSAHPWDGMRVPMDQLVAAPARKFPTVSFVHLNYAEGPSAEIRRAVAYSYAAAKLWNQHSYLVARNSSDEQDNIYFSDLGQPVDPIYREESEPGLAWREYENAYVAINSGSRPATILGGRYRLPDPPQGAVFWK
jgi:hypothetical protein